MVSYLAVTKNDCQIYVRYLLELSSPYINQTLEHLEPFAFVTVSEQQSDLIRIQGSMQDMVLDQNVFGVWVDRPEAKKNYGSTS